MKIFLTLDYEIFFGNASNDIENSLLKPTQRFIDVLQKRNCKAVFFVDAGYLIALKRQKNQYPQLEEKYLKIQNQLQLLEKQGHEIGLHVHTHWEDCIYDGQHWKMDLRRYKLADFPKAEAEAIFIKYYEELKLASSHPVISFRAGGWCLEPFENYMESMRACGILVDSTVFEDGKYHSPTHSFDFTNYPKKDKWNFNTDPSKETETGNFIEIPISSHDLPPSLYWRVLLSKVFNKVAGDDEIGRPIDPQFGAVIRKLFFKTRDGISLDSFKSKLLIRSFKGIEKKGQDFCSIIGHPKCFTEDTYQNLEKFIEYAYSQGHIITTFSNEFYKN